MSGTRALHVPKLLNIDAGYYLDGCLPASRRIISVCNKSPRSTQPSIHRWQVNRVPTLWLELRKGMFTCVGWQVTLYDPTTHILCSIPPRWIVQLYQGHIQQSSWSGFWKMSKTGATRCQITRLKCTEFAFRWGSAPADLAGELTCFLRPSSCSYGAYI